MIYLIFLTSLLFAQAPPPSLRGQEQTVRLLPKPNLQVPYSQATNLGGLDALIETGFENYLSNPNFEHQTVGTSWTIVPTSSAITTGVQSGRKAIELTPSSLNGAIITQSATPANITLSGNIEHSVWVRTSLSNIQVCAMQATNEVQCVDVAPTNTWNKYELNVAAPASGSVGVRVKSTASVTGSVFVDNAYVGPSRSIGSVAQAQAEARIFRASSDQVVSSTSATKVQFNSSEFVLSGTADTTTNYRWTASGPGYRLINVSIGLASFTANERYLIIVRINGTDACFGDISDGQTSNTRDGVRCLKFMNSGDYVEVFVQSAADTSYNVTQGAAFTWLEIASFPSQNEMAIRVNQNGWYVSANMWNVSGVSTSIGTSTISSYSSIDDAGLQIENNSGQNVIQAQIACTGTTESVGTTCNSASVSEQIGISFTIPAPSDVMACASFSHNGTYSSGVLQAVFQLVETPNNAQTITQEGGGRIQSGGPTGFRNPVRVCGTFSFSSSGKKTIRLMRELEITGTTTFNAIIADRATNAGQRDIKWEVFPINQSMPAPLLTGSVTSNSSGLERIERAVITNNGSACAISSQSGSWLSSVTRAGTGNCTGVIAGGIFSGNPVCVCTATFGQATCKPNAAPTPTALDLQTFATASGAGTDGTIYLMCMGPR